MMVTIWGSFRLAGWLRFLRRYGYSIDPSYAARVVTTTVLAGLHSLFFTPVVGFLRQKARKVHLHPSPLFIIGHWRSGTTLLHNLLAQDAQFTWPTTRDCFMPEMILWSLPIPHYEMLLSLSLPRKRPVDGMPMAPHLPQEDEFALCLLGAASPYGRLAFPNNGPGLMSALETEELASAEQAYWIDQFQLFLRFITAKRPGRPLLKSPTHTFRLPLLVRLFPQARFVFLVRSPYEVIPSMMQFLPELTLRLCLQRPRWDGLEGRVLNLHTRLHQRYRATRGLVPENQLFEMRYEDLIRNPLGQVEKLYQILGLGDFEAGRPAMERYLEAQRDFRPNQWTLTPESRRRIRENCASVIESYDY